MGINTCAKCGRTVCEHCNHEVPPTVDWHAVARDAAVRILAAGFAQNEFEPQPAAAISKALALVAEMQKREEFGGATSEENDRHA